MPNIVQGLLDKLSLSEVQYEIIINNMYNGMIIASSDGIIISSNPRAREIFSYEDITGLPVASLVPDEYLDRHIQAFTNLVVTRKGKFSNKILELVGKRKDGSEFPIEITLSYWEADGEIFICAFFRDITEENKQDEILKQSNKFFTLSLDLLAVLDSDGCFKQLNPSWEFALGFSAGEMLGKSFYEFVHPDDLQASRKEFDRNKQGRTTHSEYRFLCKDGAYKSFLWSSLSDQDHGFTYASGKDITDRINSEKELLKKQIDLERSNKELEQFAYVASHDLQEPLRMVTSYCKLLEKRYKGKLDKDADEFIHFAVTGAMRMQTLINDLLQYSRIGTNGKVLSKVETKRCVEMALNNLHEMIVETGAIIKEGKLPIVMGDTLQIVMIFQNLIGNAIKFRKPNTTPEIHINSKLDNGFYKFSVKDNGIGIDLIHRDRLFIIFQRLHNRDEYQGTGIGLAICKKIVERHGGEIGVESVPDKGSTFFFTLPDVSTQP